MSQHQVQAGRGPGLFDKESSDDALLWKTQAKVVGRKEYTHRYVCSDTTHPAPVEGVVPPGFVPCMINGIPYYHNQQQRSGPSWYSNGSKLTDDHTGAAGVGATATCGPLQIITRITGPQDSYAWASTNDPTLPPLYTRADHGLVQTTVANVGQKPQALPCVHCALQACIFARCTYGIHQKLPHKLKVLLRICKALFSMGGAIRPVREPMYYGTRIKCK